MARDYRMSTTSFTVVLYFTLSDGIHFRVREDSTFVNKCVYSAYAVDVEGNRDVLGIYISGSESSNEWGVELEDLKRREVEDILIVSVEGLSGFKETIEAVYPNTIE